MAGLIPFNRRGEMSTNNIFNMMDDFFSGGWPGRSLLNDTFKVDIKEDEKRYTVDAELPGIEKEEIKLDFSEGRLSIKVERQEESNDDKGGYIHRERRTSSMCRTMHLADADSEGIEAKLNSGILTITVPKIENKGKSSAIEIQ